MGRKAMQIFHLVILCNGLIGIPTIGFAKTYLPERSSIKDSLATDVEINFKIPKGWAQINECTFVRMDYNQELKYWEKDLNEGHMPWRFGPKNIAVTCLWSFGITNGTPVDKFANKITEIKKYRIYSLQVGNIKYIIFVKTKKNIPIAYKLEIKNAKK
jgi:hypothetical protein